MEVAAPGTAGREAGGRAGHPGSKGRAGLRRGALWEVDAALGWVGELGGREGCTSGGAERRRWVGRRGWEGPRRAGLGALGEAGAGWREL